MEIVTTKCVSVNFFIVFFFSSLGAIDKFDFESVLESQHTGHPLPPISEGFAYWGEPVLWLNVEVVAFFVDVIENVVVFLDSFV